MKIEVESLKSISKLNEEIRELTLKVAALQNALIAVDKENEELKKKLKEGLK